ncbi:MAG TPA: hypothetical protein VF167_05575 [Longimicrobiaceae bacterium]
MDEARRKREQSAREKADVNPAARRDRPGEADEEEIRNHGAARHVPPVQEEPLDPLGPGGIGG